MSDQEKEEFAFLKGQIKNILNNLMADGAWADGFFAGVNGLEGRLWEKVGDEADEYEEGIKAGANMKKWLEDKE